MRFVCPVPWQPALAEPGNCFQGDVERSADLVDSPLPLRAHIYNELSFLTSKVGCQRFLVLRTKPLDFFGQFVSSFSTSCDSDSGQCTYEVPTATNISEKVQLKESAVGFSEHVPHVGAGTAMAGGLKACSVPINNTESEFK